MKKLLTILLALTIAASAFYSIVARKQSADLLIINAVVYTADHSGSVKEAVAVRGKRIIAVGTTQDIQKRYTSQNVVDAAGKTVVPGFIDAHAHVMGLGQSLSELNLYGTRSSQQIVEMVAEKVKSVRPGEWIRGRGWDQNDWGSGTGTKPFPTAAMLDKVSPDNPVVLGRVDGHAIWVNSAAMRIAQKSSDLSVPVEGGIILRDRFGAATGVFVDNAMTLIRTVEPDYTVEEKIDLYKKAFAECLRVGLTGVHDMGIDRIDHEIYSGLAKLHELPIRIYALVGGTGPFLNDMLRHGPITDRVDYLYSLRSIKLYLDGALGSRGAALTEPYSDDPDSRGVITFEPDSIRVVTEWALQRGFQVCVHAIGDRANKAALDAFEKAEAKYPVQGRSARLRVEHAQVIAPEDMVRFRSLNVIPSMQPTHATSDMYWAQARLGPERIKGAYAWRTLLNDGNIIPAGSDFPVEYPNPLYGFYAAVTRQDRNGMPQHASDVAKNFQLSSEQIRDTTLYEGGWFPAQRLTRDEALRAFTIWGATAEFMEGEKGSIEEGKLADFVILSKDIMKVEPKEILATEVDMTIVGGEVKFKK